MNDCGVADNNTRHFEALARTEAAIKSGAKYVKLGVIIRNIKKTSINLKSRDKLSGLTNDEKVRAVIKKHKSLTAEEIVMGTGIDKAEVFRCVKRLEKAGVMSRVTGKGPGATTQFNYVTGV